MADRLPDVKYPALLWTDGYIFFAKTPTELCSHPRSLFAEAVREARAGEMYLADSSGRCFQVSDWLRVKPFGGLGGFARWLLRSTFAVPVLTKEARPSLEEFKTILAKALRGRYRHDLEKSDAIDAVRNLRQATTYETAIGSLPRL